MSSDNTVHVITDAEAPTTEPQETETKKPNFFQSRVVAPIKKHPKLALAAGLGVLLVGAAAVTGKNAGNSDSDPYVYELEPGSSDDLYVVESTDTQSA